MSGKSKQINFQGQKVYTGIDVTFKEWVITIMLEEITHKTFSIEPKSEDLPIT